MIRGEGSKGSLRELRGVRVEGVQRPKLGPLNKPMKR